MNTISYPQFVVSFFYNSKKIPKIHQKGGIYTGSVMDIANCARKEKYLLKSIFDNQPIFSWNDIIKKFIPF